MTHAYHTPESARALVETIHARRDRLRREVAENLAYVELRITATKPGPDLDHLLDLRQRAADLLRDFDGAWGDAA